MYTMFANATSFDRDLSDWSFYQEVYLDQFLDNTDMSSDNYDTLLQSFDNQNLVGLFLSAENVAYCNEQTRNNLINNKNWTIVGDFPGQCGATLNPSTTPFVTTWTVEDDLSVDIYTSNAFDYDFTVDWGDGEIDQNVTADITHDYANPGTYTVNIIGVFPYFKSCEIATGFSDCDNAPKLSSIESWGDQEWRAMIGSFRSANNMIISTLQSPNLTFTTSLKETFRDASSFNQPLNSWDVSNVTNMELTFTNASSFNQNINSWDVSNVANMERMFNGASSFNQPLESWDVSNMTSMYAMFARATSFNQPLNNWDVGQMTNMYQIFSGASAFNQSLDSWDVSKVIFMDEMFEGASSFNQPLDNWDVSNVTFMNSMFYDATSFNQDLSGWCVEQIPSEPEDFAVNSALQDDFFPNWGAECNLSTTNPEAIGFNILIYPNPSNSKVFIENDGQMILSKIKLIDMLGRDIKIFSASQITNGLDVSGVDVGNYFVQFTTVGDQKFVRRLIVK
jgi:surface protein